MIDPPLSDTTLRHGPDPSLSDTAARWAMRHGLADLADLDGRPVGRIYRSRYRWWSTYVVVLFLACLVGTIAGLVAAVAIVGYLALAVST